MKGFEGADRDDIRAAVRLGDLYGFSGPRVWEAWKVLSEGLDEMAAHELITPTLRTAAAARREPSDVASTLVEENLRRWGSGRTGKGERRSRRDKGKRKGKGERQG